MTNTVLNKRVAFGTFYNKNGVTHILNTMSDVRGSNAIRTSNLDDCPCNVCKQPDFTEIYNLALNGNNDLDSHAQSGKIPPFAFILALEDVEEALANEVKLAGFGPACVRFRTNNGFERRFEHVLIERLCVLVDKIF